MLAPAAGPQGQEWLGRRPTAGLEENAPGKGSVNSPGQSELAALHPCRVRDARPSLLLKRNPVLSDVTRGVYEESWGKSFNRDHVG